MNFQNWSTISKDQGNTSTLGSFNIKFPPKEKNYTFLKTFGQQSPNGNPLLEKSFLLKQNAADKEVAGTNSQQGNSGQSEESIENEANQAAQIDALPREEPNKNHESEVLVTNPGPTPIVGSTANTMMMAGKVHGRNRSVQDIELSLANIEKDRSQLSDISGINERLVKEITQMRLQLEDIKRILSPLKEDIVNLNVRAALLSNEILDQYAPLLGLLMSEPTQSNSSD